MRVNWSNLLTVCSSTILVGAQTVALGAVTGWAAAGLLGLGDTGAYFLEAVLGSIAFAGTLAFIRTAIRVEPVIERERPRPRQAASQEKRE